MHGFLHIFLIQLKTGEILTEIDNLTLDNSYFKLDFIQILKEEGIDLQNTETLVNASQIQFQLEKTKFPLVYHFFSSKHFILILIATHQDNRIQYNIDPLLEDLEQDYSIFINNNPNIEMIGGQTFSDEKFSEIKGKIQIKNDINQVKNNANQKKSEKIQNKKNINQEKDYFINLKKFIFLRMIARNLAEYLLPSFLIPEKRFNYHNLDANHLPETFNYLIEICQNDYNISFLNQIWEKLDGTWSILEFSEVYSISIDSLREIFFFLWKTNLIFLRMEYFPWDRFKTTIKAPLFLDEGSKENLLLINKFNSKKIIQIIKYIGDGCSYTNLVKNFDITKTKLNSYLSELLQRQIIQREDYKPELEVIPEDLIPLLSLQGFQKEDFKLLSDLAKILNGTRSIRSAALRLQIDPSRIKGLLDKYESAVKILT